MTDHRSPTAQKLQEGLRRFMHWLDRVGYESYDPYDLWGTRYGLFARRLYYAGHPLRLPFIAPIVAMETFAPGIRGWFVRKERFATADAQILLAYLNLHRLTGEPRYLDKARGLGSDLLGTAIGDYGGLGWGYPFDWQNNSGLWRKNTPFITATPYCYEAFAGLFDVTGEEQYREAAVSAARFVFEALRDTPDERGGAAASYSPIDNTKVINASAYRAFVLLDAATRLGAREYEEKALRNLEFILRRQEQDGSWLYAIDSPGEAFIDHFHTCFVLKNLLKLNRDLRCERVRAAIGRGYDYYRRALFDSNDEPRSFAIRPRTQIVRLEMYNMAEAISLGALFGSEIPEALELAWKLAARLVDRYQVAAGYFVTRIFVGGMRHSTPFLRWPQAQLFLALTNLAKHLEETRDEHGDGLD